MNNKDFEFIESDDKRNCFAWLSKCECNALNIKECKNCSFYKPKNEVKGYEKYIEKRGNKKCVKK